MCLCLCLCLCLCEGARNDEGVLCVDVGFAQLRSGAVWIGQRPAHKARRNTARPAFLQTGDGVGPSRSAPFCLWFLIPDSALSPVALDRFQRSGGRGT